MSGAAGARDDDLNAALFRAGSIFKEQVGSAVSGDHACFMWNAELAERFGGKFHDRSRSGSGECQAPDSFRMNSARHCEYPTRLRGRYCTADAKRIQNRKAKTAGLRLRATA